MLGRKFKRTYKYCCCFIAGICLLIVAMFHLNAEDVLRTESSSAISSCVAEKNIYFLKIHKTASSALLNMCLRYAIQHDVLMAIPRQYHYFGHPKEFHEDLVPKLNPGHHYNILCHHTRFNYKNVLEFMPEDVVLFTMLRDPITLFESAYSYYHLEDEFKMSLEQFVNGSTSSLTWHNKRFGGRIGRNQMAFDLGVEESQFNNKTAMDRIAEDLNQQFHLVMINDRINESLVLLKHLLCWTTDDVVVFRANARKDTAKRLLNPKIKRKVLEWNNADKILYDFFLKVFEEKVNEFGLENMKKEKAEIEARIEMWYKYCIEGTTSDQQSDVKQLKLANVTNVMCEYLTKDEEKFDYLIVKKQRHYRYIPHSKPALQ